MLLGAIAVLASCASAPTATPVSPTAGPTSTPTTVPVTATTEVTSVPASTSPTASAPPAPTAALQVGPGALATYTVQAQPAPGSCHYRWVGPDPLPDPSCTPGAVDPSVTQATIGSTICRSGWTATVRPPEDVTEPEKAGSAAAYGYTGTFDTAEYDHLVPLELGGDPNDPANLWVEPNDRPGATTVLNSKDGLEDTLNALGVLGSGPAARGAGGHRHGLGHRPAGVSRLTGGRTAAHRPLIGNTGCTRWTVADTMDRGGVR